MLAAVTVIIVVRCWADSSRQHEHVCLLEDQEEPCVGHKPSVGNVDIKGPVIFKKRQQRASQKDGTELQSLSLNFMSLAGGITPTASFTHLSIQLTKKLLGTY